MLFTPVICCTPLALADQWAIAVHEAEFEECIKKRFEGEKLDASLVQVSWWVQCSSAGSVDLCGVDVWTPNPLVFLLFCFFFLRRGGMMNP